MNNVPATPVLVASEAAWTPPHIEWTPAQASVEIPIFPPAPPTLPVIPLPQIDLPKIELPPLPQIALPEVALPQIPPPTIPEVIVIDLPVLPGTHI
ncbi:hypothetical protein [Rhodococcus qingshengii]|uniref:hypothetical protein n=1 Tax=Rhodococcus qingshengii TaxID=334542 RepID=UPI001F12CCD7|nr:hypothetical protein [Rhodococcus qingshengii]ULD38953.1 hypothetical protein JKI97_00085 [Rhodococcus qingshengii]